MATFEVTVRDFPDLKDRTRILLKQRPPEGSQCLRCGDLAGLAWHAVCGHCFCNDCKDILTRAHVLTCPVHFVQTPRNMLKRTDQGLQETKECAAACAWSGCTESGSLQYILDNRHCGLVKIIKPLSPSSPKIEMSHPLEFPAVQQCPAL
nr:uncharacterized protein LOC119178150 isoform X3 [Rhipicephalus microplus]